MSKLKIIATIIAKPECKEEVLKIMHTVCDATRKEEGNISYILHGDIKDDSKLILIEDWKSQEAIDIHNNMPHFLAFKKAIDGKINDLNIDIIKEIY